MAYYKESFVFYILIFYIISTCGDLNKYFKYKQVLGSTNCLLTIDTTQTQEKKKSSTILLLLRLYSLLR
jgi:hypothetical protein